MAHTVALILARLMFAWAFAIAAYGKFTAIGDTAGYIASIGFPMPVVLAWLAAILETALVIAFLTGILFREASLVAALYVLFLGFAFYGPGHWSDPMQFGFFVSHATFVAGLLFAAVHGPGKFAIEWGWLGHHGGTMDRPAV